MTTASFFKKNGKFYKFRISGHSGYAEQGSDIVCAAVSSMAMLTVNTISDIFAIPSEASADVEGTVIDFKLDELDERGCDLIAGLFQELNALASDYPNNIKVIVK